MNERHTISGMIRNSSLTLVIVFFVLSGTVFARAQQEQLADIEDRVNRMERLMDNKVMFDMLQRIETLQTEVQTLRDQSERNAHELETLENRQKDLYLGTDRRLQRLEGGSVSALPGNRDPDSEESSSGLTDDEVTVAPPRSNSATISAGADSSDGASRHESEYEAYNQSFTLIKNGEYEKSISSLRNFLTTYPDSKYSANAQYWLAEAHYVLQKYDVASNEFRKVMEKYPSSSKVSDAMLKLGYTYYELEQWQDARNILKLTSARYPGSNEAANALERLDRMAREGH